MLDIHGSTFDTTCLDVARLCQGFVFPACVSAARCHLSELDFDQPFITCDFLILEAQRGFHASTTKA